MLKVLPEDKDNKLENVKRVRDSIFLISKLQIIAKISRSNFVTLFKYDQVNNNLFLHFIISMKNNGDIIHDSILLDLDNIPVTSSSFIQDILNSDDKKLYYMNLKGAKKNDYIYEKMLSKNIKNIYYKNIFKDGSPIGLVVLSYNDEYFISEENEFNIVRILNIIKNLM